MDIAFGTGALGVISAHSKGAPIEILGASMTGSSDLYWFVKSDSEIKSFADTAGKTVAFSRPGSSTNLVAAALVAAAGMDAKLVPTGGPAATLTQVSRIRSTSAGPLRRSASTAKQPTKSASSIQATTHPASRPVRTRPRRQR